MQFCVEVAFVENMAEQVEDLLVDIKDLLSLLSRVRDGLKALKFSPCVENIKQIPQAVICEAQPNFGPCLDAACCPNTTVHCDCDYRRTVTPLPEADPVQRYRPSWLVLARCSTGDW